jgi:DNA polymerase
MDFKVIQRFNVCDLNAIETRVGAWLADCGPLMNVFEPFTDPFGVFYPNGKDPYLDFAGKMYGIPYEKLWADYKDKNGEAAQIEAKKKRQTAKPGVLGAIYRLGGGQWGRGKHGHKEHDETCDAEQFGKKYCACPTVYDRIRTGLWGYAWNMGVEMDQEQAHFVVRMFREAYAEIPAFWKTLEDAVADVMDPNHPATTRRVGPGGCVLIDKLNIAGRDSLMRMQLPSGRRLHYIDARMENTLMPWTQKDQQTGEERPVYRPALVYAGADQVTGVWGYTTSHGGKLFENLVQAIARDVLAVKLLEFEEQDMPVVGHVHDEGICLVPDDPFSPGVEDMVEIMSRPVSWAPGLLLGADGFEDSFYHK